MSALRCVLFSFSFFLRIPSGGSTEAVIEAFITEEYEADMSERYQAHKPYLMESALYVNLGLVKIVDKDYCPYKNAAVVFYADYLYEFAKLPRLSVTSEFESQIKEELDMGPFAGETQNIFRVT